MPWFKYNCCVIKHVYKFSDVVSLKGFVFLTSIMELMNFRKYRGYVDMAVDSQKLTAFKKDEWLSQTEILREIFKSVLNLMVTPPWDSWMPDMALRKPICMGA